MTPKISVVMPVYNGEKYLPETIESVLNQTFDDFEFIIVNELGSSAEATAILREYERKDSRIRVIQNTERLGLALSLNAGIDAATGEYIARVDGDDPSYPERFEKQAAYLDANPDVFLCGTLAKTLRPTGNNVESYPIRAEEIKASFLFGVEIHHCSVFMRREQLNINNWRYTADYLQEDYDLWAKISHDVKIVNIPEVLLDHRFGFGSKTTNQQNDYEIGFKEDPRVRISHRDISARELKRLGVNIESYTPEYVLGGFRTQPWDPARVNAQAVVDENFALLREIEDRNATVKMFDSGALHNVLARRWVKWLLPCVGNAGKGFLDKRFCDYQDISSDCVSLIQEDSLPVVTTAPPFAVTNDTETAQIMRDRSLKSVAKVVIKKLTRPFLGYIDRRFYWIMSKIDETKNILYWDLGGKIYETRNALYWDLGDKIDCAEGQITNNINWSRNQITGKAGELRKLITTLNYNIPYVSYTHGEKVRIVFLYLMPSLWPSWDTVIESLKSRSDVDFKVMLFDLPINEPEQIRGAEDLLREKDIEYVRFDDFDIDGYNPHIVVYQTPYDEYHRPIYLHASTFRGQGRRIVYITYGIEITKTGQAEMDHFKRQVVQNGWRVYTFSPTMRKDYLRHISPSVCKALGHPKFDRLYDNSVKPNAELLERAAGKKILLLKIHWTKAGGGRTYTPELGVYADFIKQIATFTDLFFVVMPHPNFFYNSAKYNMGFIAEQIRTLIENATNATLCAESDYRPTLVCANYVITDRSALMVEAGVLDVPVLYMTGNDWEPLNDAVAPIILSYYQGQTCEDMLRFIEMCRKGQDPKRVERRKAVAEWIPYFDGKAGERIAEDMVKGVMED